MAAARKPRASAKAPASASSSERDRGEAELSRAVLKLLEREPFYAHLLGGVTRAVSDATPTASVALFGARVVLAVNPHFFTAHLSPLERVAVLQHEALHLLFKHLLRLDLAVHDRALFNIAADLVVNQYISRPWKLPASALTLVTFPDLYLEPGQSVEAYYAKLVQLRNGALDAPVSREALERLLSNAGACTLDDHAGWGPADEAQRAEGSLEVDRAVTQVARRLGPRGWGPLPAPVRALVEAAIARARGEVDWRRALKLFAASSRRTWATDTLRRPSKRYGTVPGLRIKSGARLAVAIDTSGSISDDDLGLFFAELDGMYRRGAELTVFECDARVQRSYAYRGEGPPKQVAGRGGTAFDPFFRALHALRQGGARGFDGCVYLTDGCAPTPVVRPPARLLWVLTAQSAEPAAMPFGPSVRLTRPTP